MTNLSRSPRCHDKRDAVFTVNLSTLRLGYNGFNILDSVRGLLLLALSPLRRSLTTMQRTLPLLSLSLLCTIAACGSPLETGDNRSLLQIGKIDPSDQSGNSINHFGGVIHADDKPYTATAPRKGYRIAWTFRAEANLEFKLWSRINNTPGAETALYGPRASDGSYALVAKSQPIQSWSIIYYKPIDAGIYLVVQTTDAAGATEIGLNCANQAQCELGCAITLNIAPVCGADEHTYVNASEAACYDVPVAHVGECATTPSCAAVQCGPNTHCELVQVQCFTTPCDPQPSCVPNPTSDCRRSGCSHQLCADQDLISTCEWRDEYQCYSTATCERQPDGACAWTPTQELKDCLAKH
jgi:hypothetical protein